MLNKHRADRCILHHPGALMERPCPCCLGLKKRNLLSAREIDIMAAKQCAFQCAAATFAAVVILQKNAHFDMAHCMFYAYIRYMTVAGVQNSHRVPVSAKVLW
jgi:hypothetical protein